VAAVRGGSEAAAAANKSTVKDNQLVDGDVELVE